MPTRRRSGRRSKAPRALPLLLALAAALAVAFAALVARRGEERPPVAETREPGAARSGGVVRQPSGRDRAPRADGKAGPSDLPAGGGVRVALVIDDLGRSLGDLEPLGRLQVPFSYAVLPFESRSAEVAAAAGRLPGEVLCHLPMEPGNGKNPGSGALTADMGAEELALATGRALDAVPGAVGANNHMGSLLSADPESMRAILSVLAARNLFFLDSRTSAESVGYATARGLGVAAAERQVFLDGDPRPEAIAAQFARLLAIAREQGAAIAIGHPYRETFEVLGREVPRARRSGYEFVPVSYLLDDAGGPPL